MSSLIDAQIVTNYKHIMSQTQKQKIEDSQLNYQPVLITKNKQTYLPNHTLLICNGAGTILYAWGDQKVFEIKFDNLQYHNLFDLGFTQHSLNILKREIKGGLLQNERRLNCSLELVRAGSSKANSEEEFDSDKDYFIKSIDLKFSIILVKFGQQPLQPSQSKVTRQPISRYNIKDNHQAFVLVQAKIDTEKTPQIRTLFQDYIYTYEKMPGIQKVITKIEK